MGPASTTMGNQAGGDAMGHGVGNCKEVKGDSVQGYISKDSKMTKSQSGWENVNTFDDSFNTYVMTTTEHHNIAGDGNIANNNVVNGNNNVFGVGNQINMDGQIHRMANQSAASAEAAEKPMIRRIEIHAATVEDELSGHLFTDLVLKFVLTSLARTLLGTPSNWEWPADLLLIEVFGKNSNAKVTSCNVYANEVSIHLRLDVPAPQCAQVFGELVSDFSDHKGPFTGTLNGVRLAAKIKEPALKVGVNAGVYGIESVHNGKYLHIAHNSKKDATNVEVYGDRDRHAKNRPSSLWSIREVNPGEYRIRNEHSGKYLHIANNSKKDATNVEVWGDHANGRPGSLWSIREVNRGEYRIRSVHSGKYLHIANASKKDATNVEVWGDHANGRPDSLWRMMPKSG